MTAREAYCLARDTLQQAGIPSAAFEARCLLEDRFGMQRTDLKELPFSEESRQLLEKLLQKRIQGVPLQYLLGKWTFMDREYFVGEGVLIPRDDTEVAVRACYQAVKHLRTPAIADLCAGSGIIALTLSEMLPGSKLTAVEREESAFAYLTRNIEAHHAANVRAVRGDIFVCHSLFDDGTLDAIISNPPYIESSVIPTLQREVQFEPKSALDGGQDGLDFYRCIAQDWLPKLRPGGTLTLEIGETQGKAVSALLQRQGIPEQSILQDIQGLDRAIICTKREK